MNALITDDNLLQIIDGLKSCDDVEAVALGGSRSTGNDDEKSDYDLYVYCTTLLDEKSRKSVMLPLCSKTEICNHYWESEDNVVMNNGVSVDIIYREYKMLKHYLEHVVGGGNSFIGYTTCFWHNIITSKVLFDKTGNFTALQKEYTVPFPKQLKENIIKTNRKLLEGTLPSYDKQIKKATDRNDFVSVNHRISAFLESYFDVVFALNDCTHPGEKRIVELCKKQCSILPADFEKNINDLLSSVTSGNPYSIAVKMVEELDKVLN